MYTCKCYHFCMGQFIHLDPSERKEIIDNIVVKLEMRLVQLVKKMIGEYAITEEDVAARVREEIENQVEAEIQKRLRFRWIRSLFFK